MWNNGVNWVDPWGLEVYEYAFQEFYSDKWAYDSNGSVVMPEESYPEVATAMKKAALYTAAAPIIFTGVGAVATSETAMVLAGTRAGQILLNGSVDAVIGLSPSTELGYAYAISRHPESKKIFKSFIEILDLNGDCDDNQSWNSNISP